ncbi:MAG: universal stress protein [Betaproteobacteria bacterium]
MTFRSIFVHVDDTEPCDRRLGVAARLARAFPAELLGGYVAPSSDLGGFATMVLPGDVIARHVRASGAAQGAAEARFRAAAAAAGVTNVRWHAPAGDPVEAAVLHARYSDLTVIGQPPRDEPSVGFSAELAHAVVMDSGRPVLLVPSAGDYPVVGERVLIAWKDCRESARAVSDALPLLKGAKKVFAIAITPDADDSVHDMLTDAAVAAFLKRHAVEATVRRLVAPDADAGELLLSQAADFGADLIVMGGFSRSRVSDLVWGSVTRVMMQSMTAPVLMSR